MTSLFSVLPSARRQTRHALALALVLVASMLTGALTAGQATAGPPPLPEEPPVEPEPGHSLLQGRVTNGETVAALTMTLMRVEGYGTDDVRYDVVEHYALHGDTYEYSAAPGQYVLVSEPYFQLGADITWKGERRARNRRDAGVITVPEEPTTLTVNFRFFRTSELTGKVLGPKGRPVRQPLAQSYFWEDGRWVPHWSSWSTGHRGEYAVRVAHGRRVTIRITHPKWRTVFLGGRATLPKRPTARNSFRLPRKKGIPTITLTRRKPAGVVRISAR